MWPDRKTVQQQSQYNDKYFEAAAMISPSSRLKPQKTPQSSPGFYALLLQLLSLLNWFSGEQHSCEHAWAGPSTAPLGGE